MDSSDTRFFLLAALALVVIATLALLLRVPNLVAALMGGAWGLGTVYLWLGRET